ncbi:MAG: aminoacyl-tRNA hydrolase [Nitrospiraceae bacterium]|jgi:PTH1 family peptidyl-tRNA hydrolase|nr:MAG: aminoacyl-tRNA hydrolase [Nitrospiraceae bacterium]
MWLVAGLGNPGEEYSDTRHNIGFAVVDALAARYSIAVNRKTSNYLYGRGFIGDQSVVLIKPLTFMNRSGIAVREALFKYDEIENFIIIHDDLDLEPGLIRIRTKGSSGGHNGIQSIIDLLNSKEFIRLKIGIGRSERMYPEKYVLRPFNKKEKPLMEEAVVKSVEAISMILSTGVSEAQNKLHAR